MTLDRSAWGGADEWTGSVPVPTTADGAAGGADDRQDDADDDQDDADGPQDRDLEQKSGQQQDDSEDDHGGSFRGGDTAFDRSAERCDTSSFDHPKGGGGTPLSR